MKPEDFTPCLACGKPVGENNPLLFFAVTVQRMMFDPGAVRTTLGLAMMVGSARVAGALNPDPEIAKPLGEPEKFLLCDECAMRAQPLAVLFEMAEDRRETDAADGGTTVADAPAPACPPPGEAA